MALPEGRAMNMQSLPTLPTIAPVLTSQQHGMLDYGLGALLVLLPFLGGFADAGAAAWIPTLVGFALIGLGLVTDYELSAVRIVPLRVHLLVDLGAGVILLLSPFLFAFASVVWLPHVLAGFAEIGAALTTRPAPDDAAATSPLSLAAGPRDTQDKPSSDGPVTADQRPRSTVHSGQAENAAQLRRAIDSGATGDKVAVEDPAASPLGTDDEAGAPPGHVRREKPRAETKKPRGGT
jgi:hypothetical protein